MTMTDNKNIKNWFEYQKQEEDEKAKWSSQGYVDIACPNCKRQRLEKCKNGKHWCEKCNWVVEDKKYFIPSWRV